MKHFDDYFRVKLGKGSDGQDSIHKPLMLLLFLKESTSHHAQRLVRFSTVDAVMRPLLERFAESGAVEYPFVRLGNDKPRVWEVPGLGQEMPREGQTDAKRSELLRLGLAGGFTKEVWEALRGDVRVREQAIQTVLAQVREDLREEFLAAVMAADHLG